MDARAEASRRTREAILDATSAFADRWYDEITLAEVAAAAGVSQQTVVNHFGSKEQLYVQVLIERVGPAIAAHRATARVGDVASVVETAVSDYERTGMRIQRMLALAGRFETLAQAAEYGRAAHEEWVRSSLAPRLDAVPVDRREQTARLLIAALDVGMWAQLRLSQGLDVDQTRADLLRLVEDILAP